MALRVAVIGAGPAGLCAARYLSAEPDRYLPTVYEQTAAVGGTWVYTDRTGTDEHGLPVHSSMYKNLRTNLPKEAMVFPDFPYDSGLPSYMSHKEVLRYLENYAENFGLHKYIQFLTRVDIVKPVHVTPGDMKWQITTFKVTAPESPTTEQYDAVMVCNGGRNSVPFTPAIPGTDQFQGRTLHSHDYRVPEPYTGKNVVIMGGLASGVDISVELAQVAERVVISHSNPPIANIQNLPPNITQATRVESIVGPNTVRFQDGQEFHADDIVFCTGYRLSFPFLTPNCGLTVTKGRAYPLYKHVLNTTYPTMSFVGITSHALTFALFQLQIKFALGVLDGSISLPSKAAMDHEIDQDFRSRLEAGLPPHRAHDVFPLYVSYMTELAMVTRQPDPQGQTAMCDDSISRLYSDPQHFKHAEYKITGQETWERVPHQS
ncbi:flavin-containing monooxygenase FMO GS-OX5-like isoform X5 [Branchiostoma floridae]|uniref:Flavin-containing monooxygenase n=1 Tax=Branchiostoma floridae TaxID=7739 RepID=A0A9J7HED9_BRAFL|nr:flavin-containing monooxygenase FMO GS-OX5-like isoform X4 [Branchiostoma floridae]XP_035658134.1 flavin-containing monooxygenase FMO GS-OX5-like isoform X5 [Branchiostoma floridae]